MTAQAQFRLAVCLQKQGDKKEAVAAFRELIAQFPAQEELLVRARKELAALGAAASEIKVRKVMINGEPAYEGVGETRLGMDIMLPHVNGFELCRRVRGEDSQVPIIMLTAKGQESDIVLGLNLGADDYVTKLFSIDVLLARATACLRRKAHLADDGQPVAFGECRLELDAHKLFRRGKEVPLTPKEFTLLKHFVTHPGRALTRDQLLDAVWGEDLIVTQRSVDRCINTLRRKVEAQPDHPRYIITVRDLGYRFEMPDTKKA